MAPTFLVGLKWIWNCRFEQPFNVAPLEFIDLLTLRQYRSGILITIQIIYAGTRYHFVCWPLFANPWFNGKRLFPGPETAFLFLY